jgi:hypothetical protein
MSTPACTHSPKTGKVTSQEGHGDGATATTRVCDLPECIAEAITWVERYTRKHAFHVPDRQVTP